ncbi:hypothetical protein Taro_029567 [Colocasia esculenta]|uniref:Uncharacterized protein n=1 Tax=Colocasia esculenta TaxID=4460 RepID=A0A843VK50_COLES|nr:hypothetical protein [Colocasia esculenta]
MFNDEKLSTFKRNDEKLSKWMDLANVVMCIQQMTPAGLSEHSGMKHQGHGRGINLRIYTLGRATSTSNTASDKCERRARVRADETALAFEDGNKQSQTDNRRRQTAV